MRCEQLDVDAGENGRFQGFACGARQPKARACKVCRRKVTDAGRLCDFPVGSKTCDLFMCSACAKRIGDNIDYCPAHVAVVEREMYASTRDYFAIFRARMDVRWSADRGAEFSCLAGSCSGKVLRSRIDAERHLKSVHGVRREAMNGSESSRR